MLINPALDMGLELGVKAKSGGVLGASSWMRQDKNSRGSCDLLLQLSHQPAEQRPELEETALLVNEELFPSCVAVESFQEF